MNTRVKKYEPGCQRKVVNHALKSRQAIERPNRVAIERRLQGDQSLAKKVTNPQENARLLDDSIRFKCQAQS